MALALNICDSQTGDGEYIRGTKSPPCLKPWADAFIHSFGGCNSYSWSPETHEDRDIYIKLYESTNLPISVLLFALICSLRKKFKKKKVLLGKKQMQYRGADSQTAFKREEFYFLQTFPVPPYLESNAF